MNKSLTLELLEDKLYAIHSRETNTSYNILCLTRHPMIELRACFQRSMSLHPCFCKHMKGAIVDGQISLHSN